MSDIVIAHAYAGSTSERYTLRKYGSDGTLKWSASHGLNSVNTNCFAVAVDSSGNVFCGGDYVTISSVSASIRKYNSSGTEQGSGWPIAVTNSDTVYCLATDSSGSVFVTTSRSGTASRPTQKYLSNGTLSWQINYSTSHNACAVDSNGDVLIALTQDGTTSALKYTGAGSFSWNRNHTATLRAVAVDSSNNGYFAGNLISSVTTRKWNSSGTLQWSRNLHGAQVNGIAVDSSGNVYVAGVRTSNLTTRKYDSSGTLLWSADHGADVNAIAIDPADGYIYTAGVRISSVTVRKYAPDGTEVTTGWPIDTGATAYAIAFSAVAALTTNVPALSVSFALAVPYPTAALTMPALPLRFALAAPVSSTPPDPPIIGDLQTIYRLWIATGGTLLELPMRSLQSRRRRNDSTWLVVECPGISAATAAWLQSVIGAAIVVDSGTRDSAGNEVTGLFLRAYLSEVDYTRTALTGIATLTCRVDAINETLQTRALEGVTSIANEDGRYIVRCASVNHRLRPGDTATHGAISFVVNAVKYSIDHVDSWMELEEAAP